MAGFLNRRPLLLGIAASALILCFTAWVHIPQGLCAPVPTPQTPDLSPSEKEKLVRKAVALYEQGQQDKAKENLERAQTVFPENYAVPYYLGLIYLEHGDRKGAIAQWQRYTRMAPKSESALNIRKHITLLLREQAEEFAQKAVSRENKLAGGQLNDNTIAVTSFSNLGSDKLGPLGKGIAAMLITDLSQVPDLEVVDRIKLHALLKEMELGTSGLVSMETAPKIGKLLRAKHVTSGSLADIKEESMIIASAVVDAHERASIGAQEVQGALKQFYDLEKEIACQMLDDLGKDCKSAPAAFNKIHTKSMPALVWYSWGLEYFDEESYDDAREMFQKALEEDPRFELAESALLATPTSAMSSMGSSQLISSASAGGPPSSVAGTAVVGASGSGSAMAATATAGGVGLPPATALVAGVAALGGGVALAGGGGGGGGGDGGSPPPQPTSMNLTGDWKGTWVDAAGSSGDATFSLTHTGNAVNGTVSVSGDDCLKTGDISGTVSGNTLNLVIRSGAENVNLTATSDNTTKTMTGRWNYAASGSGCAGETGNFSTSLTTGGAEVRF